LLNSAGAANVALLDVNLRDGLRVCPETVIKISTPLVLCASRHLSLVFASAISAKNLFGEFK
jgi:hypothetical protein